MRKKYSRKTDIKNLISRCWAVVFSFAELKEKGEKNTLFAVRLLEPLAQTKPLEHLGESEAAKNVPDDTAQAKGVQLK